MITWLESYLNSLDAQGPMGEVSSSPAAKVLSCVGGMALIGVLVLLRRLVDKRIAQGAASNVP